MCTIVRPNNEGWFCDVSPDLIFPKLIYRLKPWRPEELIDLMSRSRYQKMLAGKATAFIDSTPKDFVLGGSWNLWSKEPHYLERCAIFENLYFPYEHEFKHLVVKNSALIWPRINICLYTSTRNPNVVFLVSAPLGHEVVAKFEFNQDSITLTEYE